MGLIFCTCQVSSRSFYPPTPTLQEGGFSLKHLLWGPPRCVETKRGMAELALALPDHGKLPFEVHTDALDYAIVVLMQVGLPITYESHKLNETEWK